MNKLIVFSLLFAVEAEAASSIEEVVVFADRAKVKRVATAPCKGGSGTAVFEPLPHTLDVRTLRGDGPSVIGVSSSVVGSAEPVDPRAQSLTAEIEENAEATKLKNAEVANLQGRQKRLAKYAVVFADVLSEDVRNPRPNVSQWGASMEAFRKQQLATAADMSAVQIELKKLARTRRKLEIKLARLGAGQAKQWRRAEVTVKCKGPTKVGLTYVLPGAEWRPEYDVDFKASKGKVGPGRARLTVAAVVRQSTGEDWTNARLRLSTAKPKLGSEAPYPAALWVTAQKEKKGKVLVQGQERRDQLDVGGAVDTTAPQGVELEDGGQAFLLSLPHRVTIVSDGRPYWVPVDVIDTRASAKLVAVPKVRPYVYRAVSFDNPAPYPLLAGRVHAFRGGSFVGDTMLSFKGIGEPLEISLGMDEEVSVKRKTLTHQDRGASFLSSTKHMARAFRIAVVNRSKGRVQVEVRENVPVSKIEDVEVELIKKGTTAGYKKDDHRGFMTWSLDLKRGQEQEVDLAYQIDLPEDWQVR